MAKLSPNGKLWMGQNTLEIPLELFALNRRRLVERLSNRNLGNSIILLQGGSEIQKYDQNNHHLFQQESNFIWCFGVVEPDFFGTIEVESGRSTLFMPRLPPDYAVWEGPIWTNEDFREKYQVDEVRYVDEMLQFLNNKSPESLLLLSGINEMSGSPTFEASFSGIENFNINRRDLYPEIIDLRTFKTDYELDVMRYVIGISADAHKVVMTTTTPGSYEYQSEAQFLFYIYNNGGSRHAAYTSICGSGPNSAILHYGHAGSPNDRQIQDGDMCCYDMGAGYFGYAADITCSFPTNGVFTDDQKIVYNAVLNANRAARAACRPGVRLTEVYNLALRTILQGLKDGGLLVGEIDDMMSAGLGRVFQPHGLSHFLGLDVHDVGAGVAGYKNHLPNRFIRAMLPGMVFTIEPGCYFIDPLLDAALNNPAQSRFIVADVLERFRGSGGVRVEDVVLVNEEGVENLSPNLPRTVEEIEAFIAETRNNN